MEVIVNGGKCMGQITTLKLKLDDLHNMIKDIKDLPECFKDFVITFDDDYHEGKYIYTIRVGNMTLESIDDNVELSYYNADTDGTTTSKKMQRTPDDIIDIAIGFGIFGKVFESMGISIEVLEGVVNGYKERWGKQQHICFGTSDGLFYMLAKRFYQFGYELGITHYGRYKGKVLSALLKDNGKQIKAAIKKAMKQHEEVA